MAYEMGIDGKLYYEAGGIPAVPSWTEYDDVQEVTLSMEHDVGDVNNRASAWKKTLLGNTDVTIDVTATYDNADTNYDAFVTAFTGKSLIAIAVMDGDITTSGNEGLQLDCYVTQMSRNEGADGTMTVTFQLKPSAKKGAAAAEPSWATIA